MPTQEELRKDSSEWGTRDDKGGSHHGTEGPEAAPAVVRGEARSAQADEHAASTMGHWASASNLKSEHGQRSEQEQLKQKKDDEKAAEGEKIKGDGKEYPKVVTIEGEKIRVASADEEKEAQEIITTIKTVYGIEVSSQAGVDAIKKSYDEVPKTVTDKLKTKEWEMRELRAINRALAHYAPILGKKRSESNRKGEGQEVTSISKVDQAIDENSASGQLDTTTMGEYFKGSKNFVMTSAGTDFKGQKSVGIFKDNETNLEANATHEIAHGLLRYKLDDFSKEIGWSSYRTLDAGSEQPITPYGSKSAGEDLSETAKYYFLDPQTLEKSCPKRFAFLKKVVESWQTKEADTSKTPAAK